MPINNFEKGKNNEEQIKNKKSSKQINSKKAENKMKVLEENRNKTKHIKYKDIKKNNKKAEIKTLSNRNTNYNTKKIEGEKMERKPKEKKEIKEILEKEIKNIKRKILKEKEPIKKKKITLKNKLEIKKTKEKNKIFKALEKKTKEKLSKIRKPKKKKEVKAKFLPEYYDLPNTYNKTLVKILAQTPFNMFVYWDISEDDKNKYKETYGENFFEITKPVLIIYNETKNYSFEIEINDFANSWYFPISDTKCKYRVELGRRIKDNYFENKNSYNKENILKSQIKTNIENLLKNKYMSITQSNNIESPNDHILFEKRYPLINGKAIIKYRNVKNNTDIDQYIDFNKFLNSTKDIYSNNEIYGIYKAIYSDEILNEYINGREQPINNPSSGNISSMSFNNLK